ncbi:MAG TPA: Fe-S cluster domain-containing protein [Caldithrix sp.]|nr:Fe-S cluster domain-containing protein [Caldithrix sp.]
MNVQIVSALITLGGLGLLFGAILAFASRIFYVEKDPRIEKIDEILPGANCGGCGYPGCSNYAEAVVSGEAEPNLCAPGGEEVVQKIAEILGIKAEAAEPMVAVVRCQGAHGVAKDKFEYQGIRDCNAAVLVHGGHKACVYGCLGFGSCVASCPFDAMAMQDNGLPVVFEDKCTACGNCVEACPKGIMELIPRSQKVFLGCVNQDAGKEVRQVCSVGCIGCALCTKPKITPSEKLVMKDNMPEIPSDWEDFETAVAKCPTKSFVVRIPVEEKEEAPVADEA